MNFKPTVLKIVIALGLGIFFGYFGVGPCSMYKVGAPASFWQIYCPYTTTLIIAIVIYSIWSLLDKNK
jgi:hypothetical protein